MTKIIFDFVFKTDFLKRIKNDQGEPTIFPEEEKEEKKEKEEKDKEKKEKVPAEQDRQFFEINQR